MFLSQVLCYSIYEHRRRDTPHVFVDQCRAIIQFFTDIHFVYCSYNNLKPSLFDVWLVPAWLKTPQIYPWRKHVGETKINLKVFRTVFSFKILNNYSHFSAFRNQDSEPETAWLEKLYCTAADHAHLMPRRGARDCKVATREIARGSSSSYSVPSQHVASESPLRQATFPMLLLDGRESYFLCCLPLCAELPRPWELRKA